MEAKNSPTGTREELLEAAERCLRCHGLAGLSTRQVAEEARMPLSQIHYHFGSKQKMLLALLVHQNHKLVQRQKGMLTRASPVWERWMQACDYLEEDLASGYVRILQEMIAAGWSDPEIAASVREALRGWGDLIEQFARDAEAKLGTLGGLTPREMTGLVGSLFMGTEAMLLLGFKESDWPMCDALRKIGEAIRVAETGKGEAHHESKTSGS
jgi:AcrR family transcriptional regulator